MTDTQQTKIDGSIIRDKIFDTSTPDYAFFTKAELCAAFSDCAERTLSQWKSEGFPEPIRYPGMTGWPLSSIRDFLKRKAEEGLKVAREMAK